MLFKSMSLCSVLLTSSFFSMTVFSQTETSPEPRLLPTYADIAPIVADNCLSCHSADVASGDIVLDTKDKLNAVSLEALNALKAGIMPLGDEGFKDTADGKLLLQYLESLQPKDLVYADIAPILKATCLSCHSGTSARKGVRLDTEAFAIQNASRALPMVTEGRMPPRNPTFKDTSDGKLLLQWFKKPLATPKS